MTRREEIYEASCECYNGYIDVVNVNADAAQDAFIKGAEWADKTMIERLRELKYGYEKDLDADPRVYERDIQLCAKISLIERLILELKEE